jgi:hypothetical protein
MFRFHISKGLRNDGSGYESAIIEAVQGCIDRGARVVSMSLGGPSKTRTAEVITRDWLRVFYCYPGYASN